MSEGNEESEDQWSNCSPIRPQIYQASSSSSPPQQVPGNSCPLADIIRSLEIEGCGTPYLKIIEQPQTHYKFRYRSEMENSHGCIYGKSYEMDKTLAKTYPEVELFNYNGKAQIRCQLVQFNNNYEHPHKLCVRDEENVSVEVPVKDNYIVRFRGMCIIHTARSDIARWLYRGHDTEDLSAQESEDLLKRCEKLGKIINLNRVRLKFSAVHLNSEDEICDPVYSEPIQNLKHPSTNILRICRLSSTHSRASGGCDVIMLVEKVVKSNIKIRFFEIAVDGTEVWSEYADFLESEVHHQCAIPFRTPRYKDLNISKRVKVWVELVRPSDGQTSEPKEFYYTAGPNFPGAKKRKIDHGHSQPYVQVENYSLTYDNSFTSQSAVAPWRAKLISAEAVPSVSPMLAQAAPAPLPPAIPPGPEYAPLATPEDEYYTMMQNMDFTEYFDWPRLFPDEDIVEPQMGPPIMARDRLASDSGNGQVSNNDKIAPSRESQHSNEDRVTINKMVKQLQNLVKLIKILDEKKKNTIAKTLEEIFDIRLSNGDTFLHVILASKQPLFDYVINSIYDCDMTHFLNLGNAYKQTILHLAVINDLPELLENLLSKGCDPMLEDIEGNNAIHYAVMYQSQCVPPLLAAIEKFNIRHNLDAGNNERQTALHLAVKCRDAASVHALVKSGASARARDATGRAPLHLAAAAHCLPAVTVLLDHLDPKDIDEVDTHGYTALQILCEQELKEHSIEMIKLLLDRNADPLKKHESHKTTAWGLARDKPAVRDLMRKYLSEEPAASDDEESDDEFESADEGDYDDCDELTEITQPLGNMSIGTPERASVPG